MLEQRAGTYSGSDQMALCEQCMLLDVCLMCMIQEEMLAAGRTAAAAAADAACMNMCAHLRGYPMTCGTLEEEEERN
jgi:hypothetical protein